MTGYTYKPLNTSLGEFRVLVVKPSSKRRNDIVKCELLTTHAGAHGSKALASYKAVSYCWGEKEKTRQVLLHGYQCRVTATLDSLLRRLRQPSSTQYLWIDALCINQDDDSEKCHQIGLMWKIYGEAPELLIWLGKGDGIGEMRMEVVERNINFYSTAIHPVTATMKELCSFEALMSEPWWERVWIVQEVVLGTRPGREDKTCVIYGRSELNWPSFIKAMERLRDFNARGRQQYPNIEKALALEELRCQYYSRSPEESYSVLWWLEKTRTRACTDPRDKVYALQSISDPTDELYSQLAANYQVDTETLYLRIAKKALESPSALNILRYCQGQRPESLPSWVPNWSTADQVQPLWRGTDHEDVDGTDVDQLAERFIGASLIITLVSFTKTHYNATIDEVAELSIDEDMILHSKGIIFDIIGNVHEPFIANVTDPWENATNFMIAVGECKTLQAQLSLDRNPYFSEDGRLNAFWRTLMADHNGGGEYHPFLSLGPRNFKTWLPPLPDTWEPDIVFNVTTRSESLWQAKVFSLIFRHGFATYLRRKGIQLNEYTWSDFAVEQFENLPSEMVELGVYHQFSAINLKEYEELYEKLAAESTLSPQLVNIGSFCVGNLRSPEILEDDKIRKISKDTEAYMVKISDAAPRRWELQDRLNMVAELWQSGPYDLIDSPFCFPSVVPDPFEKFRKDPQITWQAEQMEPESVELSLTDSEIMIGKLKTIPDDATVGYSGDKGCEKYALGRSFFITNKNYMGLGPQDTRAGDIVALLFGSKVPLILRQYGTDTKRFTLIGEAHIQGIMDGEVVRQWRAEGERPGALEFL